MRRISNSAKRFTRLSPSYEGTGLPVTGRSHLQPRILGLGLSSWNTGATAQDIERQHMFACCLRLECHQCLVISIPGSHASRDPIGRLWRTMSIQSPPTV